MTGSARVKRTCAPQIPNGQTRDAAGCMPTEYCTRLRLATGRRARYQSASGEQQLEIVGRQIRNQVVVGLQDGVGKLFLLDLQLGNFLFDRVATNQPIGEYLTGLADAVRPVDRLHLNGGVPPGIEQKDVIGGRQIEPQPAGLQTDQEHAAGGVRLKVLDPFFAIPRLPVEVFICDGTLLEIAADDRQVARELRKDERLMPLFKQIGQVQPQHVEFGAGIVDVFRVEQGRVAGRLPQPQQSFENVNL